MIKNLKLAKHKKFGEYPPIVLKSKNVQFYGACILTALEYLHKNSIIFKDLKPENVIISKDGFAKLTDFGLSSHKFIHNPTDKDKDFDQMSVTTYITAPEIIEGQCFSEASDLWSFGCLLYEMAVG